MLERPEIPSLIEHPDKSPEPPFFAPVLRDVQEAVARELSPPSIIREPKLLFWWSLHHRFNVERIDDPAIDWMRLTCVEWERPSGHVSDVGDIVAEKLTYAWTLYAQKRSVFGDDLRLGDFPIMRQLAPSRYLRARHNATQDAALQGWEMPIPRRDGPRPDDPYRNMQTGWRPSRVGAGRKYPLNDYDDHPDLSRR